MKNLSKNNLIAGALLVAVLGALYYVYSGSSSGPLLSSAADTAPASAQLLQTLGNLHTLTLNPAVFSDPVFMSLSDFGVSLPPENVGRRNPFAPLGGAGLVPAQ